ncbi:MAG: PPK2 family polyphosphate kinase [Elusimicrobiota bacterium]
MRKLIAPLCSALIVLCSPGSAAWSAVAVKTVPVGPVAAGIGAAGAAVRAGLRMPVSGSLNLGSTLPAFRAAALFKPHQSPQVGVLPSVTVHSVKDIKTHGIKVKTEKRRKIKSVISGLKETARVLRAKGGKSKAAGVLSASFDGESYLVPYDDKGFVDLEQENPEATPGFKPTGRHGNNGSRKAVKKLAKDVEKLKEYQQRLYASGERSVLLVFQAMDTGGKDGAIRYVLGPLNPQGVKVASFKQPTAGEKRHNYLWRIRKALPAKGMLGVFNRSHYEDILVPTVDETMPAAEVEKRYAEIRDFEKALADSGVVILKFFLNISKDEQKRRLQARLDDPDKRWKFSPSDLTSRAKWGRYLATYGKILARTSTPWAPWYVIPANNKWFRNFLIGRIIRRALDAMGLRYPAPPAGLDQVVIPD